MVAVAGCVVAVVAFDWLSLSVQLLLPLLLLQRSSACIFAVSSCVLKVYFSEFVCCNSVF